MRSFFFFTIIVLCSTANGQMVYPPTRVVAESTTLFDTKVEDPYQWMEDLESKEVKDWRDSQNALTMDYLDKSRDTRNRVRETLVRLSSTTEVKAPDLNNGRAVWLSVKPGENQPSLRTKLIGSDEETVLVDPNKMADDGSLSIANFWVSPDGEMMTFQVRTKGKQEFAMYVKSTANNNTFYKMLSPSRTSGTTRVGWVDGHRAFYYVREVFGKDHGADKKGIGMNAVYFHAVGSNPERDILIFGDESHPAWRYFCVTSDDDQWLILSVWEKTGLKNGLILFPLNNGVAATDKPVFIAAELDSRNRQLSVKDGKLVMWTNKDAPNYRVVAVDLKNSGTESWKDIVSERSSAIDNVVSMNGQLAVQYTVNGGGESSIFNEKGKLIRTVELPGIGSLGPFVRDLKNNRLLFTFSTMVTPSSLFSLDMFTGKVSLFKATTVPFESSQYEVVREPVTARDGTQLLVFIAQKKGAQLDGKSYVLLWGYGGFNFSIGSSFASRDAAWLEMGGSIAYALIRGGGEFGENWRKGGMLLNKKNTFHDFVDIAQFLVDKKYTSTKRLSIIGESNGGLLVAAAVNERPQLFGAAANIVGLSDMVRFETAKTVFDWTDEYGTVKNKDDFFNLLSYSPIHNIATNVEYPAIFTNSGELDDRVLPWQQFKYVATLQNRSLGNNPKLMRVSYGTGHAFGKSMQTILDEQTDTMTFLMKATGMYP